MLTRRRVLVVVVVGVILAVGTTAWYARAQDQAPTHLAQTPSEPTPNLVVAAFPSRQETEYEPDPFDPDRVRSSRTEVKELILVRADGSIESKRAW